MTELERGAHANARGDGWGAVGQGARGDGREAVGQGAHADACGDGREEIRWGAHADARGDGREAVGRGSHADARGDGTDLEREAHADASAPGDEDKATAGNSKDVATIFSDVNKIGLEGQDLTLCKF
jgi:hypothetical protein